MNAPVLLSNEEVPVGIFRKEDTRPAWDQTESEFDPAAAITVWLTLSVVALVVGVVAWLVEGFVWPSVRHWFG